MIYITGDTHGDYQRFRESKFKKLKKGDTLIVCGDFGFIWGENPQEAKILKKLSKKKYRICFVDGTHEDFARLAAYPVCKWNGGKVHAVADNIFHLMRGQVFTIEGKSIFTMGGGESPDFEFRAQSDSWSRLETPAGDELLEGANNLEAWDCQVDYIITHEPPGKIKNFLRLKEKEEVRVTGLNSYFEELSGACTYQRWFFGSMHLDKYVSSSHIALFHNLVNAQTGEPIS